MRCLEDKNEIEIIQKINEKIVIERTIKEVHDNFYLNIII